jgi:pyrimidine dimer DNA glycosylase
VRVQTFLPYADFAASAEVLDDRRLGKQRVEALQILRALTRSSYGWQHHPAVAMWRGYELGVARYGLVICQQWASRGHPDTCAETIVTDLAAAGLPVPDSQAGLARRAALPSWLGEERLHRSHQSSLVRKDPEHYRRYFPDVPDDLAYVWPVAGGRKDRPAG